MCAKWIPWGYFPSVICIRDLSVRLLPAKNCSIQIELSGTNQKYNNKTNKLAAHTKTWLFLLLFPLTQSGPISWASFKSQTKPNLIELSHFGEWTNEWQTQTTMVKVKWKQNEAYYVNNFQIKINAHWKRNCFWVNYNARNDNNTSRTPPVVAAAQSRSAKETNAK